MNNLDKAFSPCIRPTTTLVSSFESQIQTVTLQSEALNLKP